MEYIGKLYAKIGEKYVDTNLTSYDWDELQKPTKQMVVNLIGKRIQQLLENEDAERWIVKSEISRLQELHKVCEQI